VIDNVYFSDFVNIIIIIFIMKDFLNLSIDDEKLKNWRETSQTIEKTFDDGFLYLS
jgi:hypothetical protein